MFAPIFRTSNLCLVGIQTACDFIGDAVNWVFRRSDGHNPVNPWCVAIVEHTHERAGAVAWAGGVSDAVNVLPGDSGEKLNVYLSAGGQSNVDSVCPAAKPEAGTRMQGVLVCAVNGSPKSSRVWEW